MAHIISLTAQKGGCGKTTLATNLARSFQRQGLRVLLIDCDAQGTATEWASKSEDAPATVQQTNGRQLQRSMDDVTDSFDVALIDGAAQVQAMTVAAVKASDLVLVPVQPSGADVWSAEDVTEIIHARQEVTGGRPRAALVISRSITGTNLATEARGFLEGLGLPVLEGTAQRIAYVKALTTGRGVQDLSPSSKAAEEIDQLTDDVESLLTNEPT